MVHYPTVAGNNPGDDRTIGLDDAIVVYCQIPSENNLTEVILLRYSYTGMIITGAADRWSKRVDIYGK